MPHDGRFPLIVFAHGFGTDPNLGEYSALLDQWASAGFVVRGTAVPLTRGDAPSPPSLAELPESARGRRIRRPTDGVPDQGQERAVRASSIRTRSAPPGIPSAA